MTDAFESFAPLTRSDAENKIKPYVFEVQQDGWPCTMRAVKEEEAQFILGSRFFLLKSDPIRNKGPKVGTFYPWNLVDYLSCFDPRVKVCNGKSREPQKSP